MSARDILHYDTLIVGAGPAGLACAIRLRELQPQRSVCVLEKAAVIGAHAMSGAIIDPRPLDELWSDWRREPPSICVPVRRDEFRYLTARHSLRLPTPPPQRNHGHFIVALSQLLPKLAARAEALGAELFPGFAASRPLYRPDGSVAGVQLGDLGRRRDGSEKPGFVPGAEVHAALTVIAEGCRGSVAKQLIARYGLGEGRSPPAYGLGFKELWRVPPARTQPGLVQHTVGWPLDAHTYGGGFVYHLEDGQLYVGFVVGLDYRDPRLAPFEAFQQFKHHPALRALLEGGEPLAYGARALAAGGWQALPRLEMPGALLVGDAAGMLDVARLKGVHQALHSGMLAAEHIAASATASGFDARWRASRAARELRRVRNIKPGFRAGLWLGLGNAVFETATRGQAPWTLRHAPVFRLETLARSRARDRRWRERTLPPRDRTAAVYLAATSHEEDQPNHLHLQQPQLCIERCTREYGNPCTRFCPAAVFEIVEDAAGGPRLQINSANCVHCKACDIKDPYEIIDWEAPEGGSGPNYHDL